MVSKVRVYGKAQNRTVLGIVNAYLLIHPNATLDDLRKAFPVELNPYYDINQYLFYDKKSPIPNYDDTAYQWNVFTDEQDILKLSDGTEIYFMKMWRADAFAAICAHAKQFGIEIAEFKPREGFKKGGFTLEYLNGFTPAVPVAKPKKSSGVLWILVLVVLALLLFFLFFTKSSKPADSTLLIVDTVKHVVVDTIFKRN